MPRRPALVSGFPRFGLWRQRRSKRLLKKVTKEFVLDCGTFSLQSAGEAQALLHDLLLHRCCPASRSTGGRLVGATLCCPHSLSAAQPSCALRQTMSKKVLRMVVLLPWEECSFFLKCLPLRFGELWVPTCSHLRLSCFQKVRIIEAVEVRSSPAP